MATHNSSGRNPHWEGVDYMWLWLCGFEGQFLCPFSERCLVWAGNQLNNNNKKNWFKSSALLSSYSLWLLLYCIETRFLEKVTKRHRVHLHVMHDGSFTFVLNFSVLWGVCMRLNCILTLPSLRWPPLCVITTTSIHFLRCCWERQRKTRLRFNQVPDCTHRPNINWRFREYILNTVSTRNKISAAKLFFSFYNILLV